MITLDVVKQDTAKQDIVKQTTHQRIVVVTRHGRPEVLQAIEEPLPEPQAGEARVRVLAAGVSAYDLMLPQLWVAPWHTQAAIYDWRGLRRHCRQAG